MMDAGLIEYVSIATPIKVSRMIWAYDGCRLAYWQASLRMFARKFFFDHSQSMLEVRLRRNRVFSFLIGRKQPFAYQCINGRLGFSDNTASILNFNQHVFV